MSKLITDYIRVSTSILVPDQPLKLDIYLHMKANGSILHFRSRGDMLSREEVDRLNGTADRSVLVLKSDYQTLQTLRTAEAHEDLMRGQVQAAAVQRASLGILQGMEGDMRAIFGKVPELVEDMVNRLRAHASLESYDDLLKALKSGTEDPLKTHNRQVSALAVLLMLAEGKSAPEHLVDAGTAGLVHDAGLEELPLSIQRKHLEDVVGGMSRPEVVATRAHLEVAQDRVLTFQATFNPRVVEIVSEHHECWDGSGPHGLAGASIPRPARFIRIADDIVGRMCREGWTSGFLDTLIALSHENYLVYDREIISALHQKLLEKNA